jgi:hypothetical protein
MIQGGRRDRLKTVGSPSRVLPVTVHIRQEEVIPYKGRRYVFVRVLSPRIYALSVQTPGLTWMASRFAQLVAARRYTVVDLYGLEAIDIQEPNRVTVAFPLTIIVGDGTDTVRMPRQEGA